MTQDANIHSRLILLTLILSKTVDHEELVVERYPEPATDLTD